MFESLESRRHLDATIDARGAVTVTGTDGPDDILIWRAEPGVLRVDVNGTITNFRADGVGSIHVNAGGGDDHVVVGTHTPHSRLRGGDGNDFLRSGNGSDVLYGGDGDDRLYGRAGNDTLVGGRGADDMTGGDGVDTVDYSGQSRDLSVGVGRVADDGRPGERDNVRTGIEIVEGGPGNDHMRNMGDAPVTLRGNGGRDTLLGGAGGADDLLYGGPGRDTLNGIGGVSTFRANDGEADVLIGGAGFDPVEKDRLDVLKTL
jgi:Ca2+-binding RTX toxin-like protein